MTDRGNYVTHCRIPIQQELKLARVGGGVSVESTEAQGSERGACLWSYGTTFRQTHNSNSRKT